MTAQPNTRRQHAVLDYLQARAALSRESASAVPGWDEAVAENLARRHVLNKRVNAKYGAVYWIRSEGEAATGVTVVAGFVVILLRDLTTPSGRRENLFLARAPYDGKGPTFRRLLRGWMKTLDLRTKDLLGSSTGFELIEPDAPVFAGDHVILDAEFT